MPPRVRFLQRHQLKKDNVAKIMKKSSSAGTKKIAKMDMELDSGLKLKRADHSLRKDTMGDEFNDEADESDAEELQDESSDETQDVISSRIPKTAIESVIRGSQTGQKQDKVKTPTKNKETLLVSSGKSSDGRGDDPVCEKKNIKFDKASLLKSMKQVDTSSDEEETSDEDNVTSRHTLLMKGKHNKHEGSCSELSSDDSNSDENSTDSSEDDSDLGGSSSKQTLTRERTREDEFRFDVSDEDDEDLLVIKKRDALQSLSAEEVCTQSISA